MFKKTGEPIETKNPATFQIPKKEAMDNDVVDTEWLELVEKTPDKGVAVTTS